jgi:uncharacterized protein
MNFVCFMETKFIADVHLGKLARLLRMLGFDTVYENSFATNELISISREQERILLSRNSSFAKDNTIKTFITTAEEPLTQLKQVVEYFELKNEFHPFSRCIVCNGELQTVSKQEISHLLPENTFRYFNEFWQCSNCRRIYWKGSHYERMLQTIQTITF